MCTLFFCVQMLTIGCMHVLKKLLGVAPVGKDVTKIKKKPPQNFCMICNQVSKKVISCEKCHCGKYCSHECMQGHKNHNTYCEAICSLEQLETEKRIATEIFTSDSEKLPYKLKLKLIRLVGERPLINIFLNGKEISGLWDTGAMISLINEEFLHENFPDSEIHPISDFTGSETLTLKTANQSNLCVEGVVVLDFGVDSGSGLFQIPFLVTSEKISNPIIGYNTVEHLVTNFKDKIDLPRSMIKLMGNLSSESAECMANLVEKGGEISELSKEAKLDKTQVIPPGSIQKIRCKIKDLQISNVHKKLVLFTPFEELCVETELVVFESPEVLKSRKKYIDILVHNPTSNRIIVQKGTPMGQVSDVAAAFT